MFAKNLKYLRNKRDMTQQELGLMLNKSESSISEWEKGKYEPRSSAISKVASIFGVSIEDLMEKDLSLKENTEIQEYDPDAIEIAQALAEAGYGELNILFKKVGEASAEDKKKMIDMLKIMLPKDDEDF